MKLYPPIIEGTIPAFYGDTIKVPFEMNKAVSHLEISGFSLKFKTVQSNRYFGDTNDVIEENGVLIFKIPESIKQFFNTGEFYKVQLAYIDKTNLVGYYSTVGVVKYTSNPEVTISTSTDGTTFTGVYSQKGKDITEKVYSYRFDLTDSSGNIFETSGEQLHNNSFDTEIFESIDQFTITKELEKNKVYYLTYTITTINGLIKSSQPKRLTKTDSIDSKLRTKLTVKLDYENGYVDLNLVKPEEDIVEQSAVGSFMLLRASDEDDYSSWNEVLKFVLYGQQPSRHLWKDMTVKQGVNYKYAIQQYNEHGLKTNKIESGIIYVDFEHAYLFDGQRQLKIKYNPKVSSFKNTLLESKVDTIGSKHPFIFRNGNVKYKEFPISGMISYLSDENGLFYNGIEFTELIENRLDNEHDKITLVNLGPIKKDHYLENYSTYYIKRIIKNQTTGEIIDEYMISWKQYVNEDYPDKNILNWSDMQFIVNEALRNKILYENFRQQQYLKYSDEKIKTTNLTSHNMYAERNFKLEVLEWLTNGEPKLFRSPGEGNYLVRLLNVSMTPQDSLGRMLHTFNCTAYEVADYTYKNLADFGIITTTNPTTKQLRWQTIELPKTGFKDGDNILTYPASAVYFEGMIPGDKLYIDDGIIRNGEQGYSVVIGSTGSYIIDLKSDVLINKISFEGSPDNMKDEDGTVRHQGSLTYSYYTTDFKDSFDTVYAIDVKQVPTRQFIGSQENIINSINNIKQQLSSIGYIRFYLRDSDEELYRWEDNGNYYYTLDKQGLNKINPQSSVSLYKLYLPDGSFVYYDGYNNKEIDPAANAHDATTIIFNGTNRMDLWDTFMYEIKTPEDITSIQIGDGIICEITYQVKEIGYDIENTVDYVIAARTEYINAQNKYYTLMKDLNTDISSIIEKQKECERLYKIYLKKLEQAIAEAERR